MYIRFLYGMACKLYGIWLRPLIKKAVNDPEEEWDDALMGALDFLFRFSGGITGTPVATMDLLGFLYDQVCDAYSEFIRQLVLKAIDNPESEIDDVAMKVLDFVFRYKG